MVENVQLSEVQATAVRRELRRILENPLFQTSERSSRLLQYLVTRSLEDPTRAIKERQVGHEAFGKAPDYDTGAQPVVITLSQSSTRRRCLVTVPGSRVSRLQLRGLL